MNHLFNPSTLLLFPNPHLFLLANLSKLSLKVDLRERDDFGA
jgi:hypothetical protein